MKKYAVLIGNELFPNEPDKKWHNLKCAKNDITELEKLLINAEIGGFDDVEVLPDKTTNDILWAIENVFHKATIDDLILIYYSGHGVQAETTGKLYLSANNTVFDRPASTAVAMAQIRAIMDIKSSRKKVILILDCCYSGDAGKDFACKGGTDAELAQELAEQAKGIYLLAAAGSTVAVEGESHGLFTKYLLEGIETGDADAPPDGYIDIHELFNYIRPRVEQERPSQQPRFYGMGETGGILKIAKSGRDSRTERAKKVRLLLLDLAKQDDGIDDFMSEAISVAKMSFSELSESQLQQDQLLTQFLIQKPSPATFVMKWVKISSTHAHHNESKVTNNKPPKQPDNQDQYGRYLDMTVDNVRQRFRWIEAGTFLMGSPDDEAERSGNEKQHSVTLNQGYWLADTACTQALWQAVMGNNPSRFKGDNLPVEQVSYLDVQQFISRLYEKTGESYTLPTEAQWEYACRAKTTTPFYTGECINTEQANYDGNYDYDNRGAKTGVYKKTTVAVGSYPANPWGLYDMAGNVWEWTDSVYDANYGGAELQSSSKNDANSQRVIRGGSWYDLPTYSRSADRGYDTPDYRYFDIGFRLSRM
jgi:formylglycine-generating enzyme required for sulfatase activity